MSKEEMLDKLASWLHQSVKDFSIVERPIGENDLSVAKFEVHFYTHTNFYLISATLGPEGISHLGGLARSRTERPGENWKRGNDLPNGPFSGKTWKTILSAILKYETQELNAKPANDLSRTMFPKQHNLPTDFRIYAAEFPPDSDLSAIDRVVAAAIETHPNSTPAELYGIIQQPYDSDLPIQTISPTKLLSSLYSLVNRNFINQTGMRKAKLYPVQEWLVKLQASGDDWVKAAGLQAEIWKNEGKEGPFRFFHFDTGRRSGKRLMLREIICREVETLVKAPEKISNILYITGNNTVSENLFLSELKKDLSDSGFKVRTSRTSHSPEGDVLEVEDAGVHIHIVNANSKSWYVGKKLENLTLVCLDDVDELDKVSVWFWSDHPRYRAVMMYDQPSGMIDHLLHESNAVSLKFPPQSVNLSLLP